MASGSGIGKSRGGAQSVCEIFTDGACSGNGNARGRRLAGMGVYCARPPISDAVRLFDVDEDGDASNASVSSNRAELVAALMTLARIPAVVRHLERLKAERAGGPAGDGDRDEDEDDGLYAGLGKRRDSVETITVWIDSKYTLTAFGKYGTFPWRSIRNKAVVWRNSVGEPKNLDLVKACYVAMTELRTRVLGNKYRLVFDKVGAHGKEKDEGRAKGNEQADKLAVLAKSIQTPYFAVPHDWKCASIADIEACIQRDPMPGAKRAPKRPRSEDQRADDGASSSQ